MGIALHIIAAMLIVLGISFNAFIAIPLFVVLGFFWEKTQHRYVWSIQDGKLHREKTGFFGWITKHRLLEASGWPIGAIIASVAWLFIRMALINIL